MGSVPSRVWQPSDLNKNKFQKEDIFSYIGNKIVLYSDFFLTKPPTSVTKRNKSLSNRLISDSQTLNLLRFYKEQA